MIELTKEQLDIKKAAREFAEREIPKYSKECDEKEEFPWDLWRDSCKHGFVGVFIDEAYKGQGYGYLENALIWEEFHGIDPGCGFATLGTTIGAETLLVNGNEDQKLTYLPPLVKGKAIMAIMVTEPQAGSDVAGIKTKAEKIGNYWVINGTKTFSTNGSIADYAIVLARTEDSGERHRRFSTFIVDLKEDGVERRKLTGKLGMRASDTAEITFKNVHVPKENLMGKRGGGFYHIMDFFNRSRTWVAAQAVGAAKGALGFAIEYSREREAFGNKIASFQAIQFKIAEMATKLEAARLLAYKAAYMLDKGEINPVFSAMAKWYAAKIAVEIVDEALQIHGGIGYFSDHPISRFYRDVKAIEIYEGTKEIEKWLIGRRILGVQ
ncbi:MAG: acyl-CoA/acyl-ACP dehydrogenase [Archaeoglobus sp.]|nr:acyl-CoA/acyl-ACP dehydrogenase [Archaeoglobus sp.]